MKIHQVVIFITFTSCSVKNSYNDEISLSTNDTQKVVNYYKNTEIKKSEGHVVGNKEIGEWKFWDENGKIISKQKFSNDMIYITDYFQNSMLVKEVSVLKKCPLTKLSISEGIDSNWTEIILMENTLYKDSALTLFGKYKSYYDNGNIKEQGSYYCGYSIEFVVDRQDSSAVKEFFVPVKDGKWSWYSEDGLLLKQIQYEVGVPIDSTTHRTIKGRG
jgi:antitoxin component YwqK of YwqJK toxin-antitoxin module